jgi:hypothetical protein
MVEISALALWFAVLTHYLVESPSRRSRLHVAAWLSGGAVASGSVAALSGVVILTLPAFIGTGAAASSITLGRADTGDVQKALVSGLGVTAVPRNLTPSLDLATQDQPVSTRDRCHLDFLQVSQPACVYGDPQGKKTIALYGDSHAQQWLPALDAEAKAKGWRVVALTKAACSVADMPVYSDVLRRAFTECMTWRTATFDRLVALHPDLLLVSQSDAVPGKTPNTQWADATARTMVKLKAAGVPVAYMLDTPMPRQDVPECVATHLDDVGACNTPVADDRPFEGRMQLVRSYLKENKVTTVDPADWLCTKAACPAIVGNMLVYRDDSHITATYSTWLAPMTAPLFGPEVASGAKG